MTEHPATPELQPYKVQPPPHIRVRRFRNVAGRCYELAGRFVLEHPDASLVHGLVKGSIQHAWAEIDGLVYDGTCRGLFRREGYYAVMRAEPVRVLTQGEMCEEMGKYWEWLGGRERGPNRRF